MKKVKKTKNNKITENEETKNNKITENEETKNEKNII